MQDLLYLDDSHHRNHRGWKLSFGIKNKIVDSALLAICWMTD